MGRYTPPTIDLVLFDGVCKLCQGWAGFLHRRDTHHRLRFISLQSQEGMAVLEKFHTVNGENLSDPGDPDSIVLVHNGNIYTKSTAVLLTFRRLGPPWSWLYIFRLLPAWLRNGFYDWIARNRYRWFGRTESCAIDPT